MCQGVGELLNCPGCPQAPAQDIPEKESHMCGLGLTFLPGKLGSHVQQQQEGAKLDKREPFTVLDDLT